MCTTESPLAPLLAEDKVEIGQNGMYLPLPWLRFENTHKHSVTIGEGTYLDSFKYETTGPRLVNLTRKTINFMVLPQVLGYTFLLGQ